MEASQEAGNSVELPRPQRCWPWSWWKRPWLHNSPLEVSIRPMSDQEPGEGWQSTDTFVTFIAPLVTAVTYVFIKKWVNLEKVLKFIFINM